MNKISQVIPTRLKERAGYIAVRLDENKYQVVKSRVSQINTVISEKDYIEDIKESMGCIITIDAKISDLELDGNGLAVL